MCLRLVAQSCPTLCNPMDCSPHRLLCPWNSPGQDNSPRYGSGLTVPSPGDLPDPGIKPRSSALQADSLPSEPPGSPCPALNTLSTHVTLSTERRQAGTVVIPVSEENSAETWVGEPKPLSWTWRSFLLNPCLQLKPYKEQLTQPQLLFLWKNRLSPSASPQRTE